MRLNKSYGSFKKKLMNTFYIENKIGAPFKMIPLSDFTNENSVISLPETTKPDWDSIFISSKQTQQSKCTNNEIGVENEYYDYWIRGQNLRKIRPVDEKDNREFQDFLMLLKFLQFEKCKPFFVIMPLNPLAHDNLQDLNPTISRIQEELAQKGFAFYNMFDTSKEKYEKEILSDVMHPSNYGWYKIDKAIYEHFIENKN
jgi:D-alanine transfer protein